MPAYGIIGYPLGHSFSPAYFEKKFAEEQITDATFKAYPLPDIKQFTTLLHDTPDLRGLSVTIPYKETIIPYLDHIDEIAKTIGAVNSISIKDRIKTGYNTDAIGFEQSLLPLLKPSHTQALVLGTGGASHAIAYVLGKLGIPYQKVSRIRRPDVLSYNDITEELVQQNTLIINTTPLGMSPLVDTYPPMPYQALTPFHLLYDVVYNPEETKFMSLGKAHNAAVKNGHEMLVLQAEASWKIWNS